MMRSTTLSLNVAVAAAMITVTGAQGDVHQIELNYNFNGIVHRGEDAQPDALDSYRSISDRGLNFVGGVPKDDVLDKYLLVDQPFVYDIVHIGNRNTVDRGRWAFDLEVNGDDIGIQPDWLVDPDQTAMQTTVLKTPIPIVPGTSAGIIFQISNGGGEFDVVFTYAGGRKYTTTIFGPDWFGPFGGEPNIGEFEGTGFTDFAGFDETLLLTEAIVDLSDFKNETLTEISFGNRANQWAGYAVLAVNVETGVGPELTTLGSCPGRMGFAVSGATPNKSVAFIYAFGQGSIAVPNGNPCAGVRLGLNATAKLAAIKTAKADGTALLDVKVPGGACGSVYMQALDFGACVTSNVILVE